MAIYVFLGKRVSAAAPDAPRRSISGRDYAEQLGIKVLGHYTTLGEYEVVTICEGPDDPTVYFKIAAFGSADGSMSWTALPAMPYADFTQLAAELPA